MDQTEQAKGRPTNRSRPLQGKEKTILSTLVGNPSESHPAGGETRAALQYGSNCRGAGDGAGSGVSCKGAAHITAVSSVAHVKIVKIQGAQPDAVRKHTGHIYNT